MGLAPRQLDVANDQDYSRQLGFAVESAAKRLGVTTEELANELWERRQFYKDRVVGLAAMTWTAKHFGRSLAWRAEFASITRRQLRVEDNDGLPQEVQAVIFERNSEKYEATGDKYGQIYEKMKKAGLEDVYIITRSFTTSGKDMRL